MLVEDNPDYRQAVSLALEDEPWIEEYADLWCRRGRPAGLANRTGKNPLPASSCSTSACPASAEWRLFVHFQSLCPEASIIMLTQSRDQADVIEAIRQGAAGYLLKSASMDQLIEGIAR